MARVPAIREAQAQNVDPEEIEEVAALQTADDIELSEAEAVAQAELEAEGGTGSGEQGADHGDGATVPASVVIAMRRDRKALEAKVDKLTDVVEKIVGVVLDGKGPSPEGKAAAKPEPASPKTKEAIEAALEEIETARDKIAQDVDDGTLTNAEARKDLREMSRKERELTLQLADLNAPKHAPRTDFVAEVKVRELEQAYPAVTTLSEAEMQSLAILAGSRLLEAGVTLEKGNPLSDFQVQREVARLAQGLFGNRAKAPDQGTKTQAGDPAKTPGKQQQPPAAPPRPGAGKTPSVADQRARKMAEQRSTPPRTPAASGGGVETLSEDDILNMTEEQIAALPDDVQRRIEEKGF